MNVEITGPKILWESSWSVPVLGKFQLTESLLDAWIILAAIALLCWWLGRGLTVDKISKKQAVAELLVTTCGDDPEKMRQLAEFCRRRRVILSKLVIGEETVSESDRQIA